MPLTGPAYGATPKVPRSDGSLIKGVAKLGTVGTMSLGMLVGTAAFGPGGAGIGAMIGAKGAGVVMGVADYGYGITRNYMVRNRFLEETKKVSGIESDVEAAIFAATGVRATKREILADPVADATVLERGGHNGLSRRGPTLTRLSAFNGRQ